MPAVGAVLPVRAVVQRNVPSNKDQVMSNLKVLVADDELHLTHIVRHKLKQQGFEVLVAHDGEQAAELVAQHHPALIVTDYQMPNLDGYGLCMRLQADDATRDIPVIMLTARGHKLTPSQLAQTNIQHLMEKPFSSRELIAKVNELLLAYGHEAA